MKHFVTKRVHRSNIKGRAVGGGGEKTFQKFSHLWGKGGGVPTILLKREDNGGVATFLLVKFPLLHFDSSVFSVSHARFSS